MVVTKTKKKVTKVTKHKVTNNKTKKRNKNKRGGGAGGAPPISPRRNSASAIRPKSASASGTPKSASAIRPKSASASRDKRAQNAQTPLESRDDAAVIYGDYSKKGSRPSSAIKRQQTPPSMRTMPLNITINVPAFNEKYYNAIYTANAELLKPHIKGGPTIPDIINNMLKVVQGGGSEYSHDIGDLLTSASGDNVAFTSQLLRSQKFEEPNPAQHNDTTKTKYDVVIVGCSPEALYMSILLKLLMPGLTIVVLECGENAQKPNPDAEAAADGPAATSEDYQPARTKENLRALTNETMMSLSYIWGNAQIDRMFSSILDGIMCPPSRGPSTRGNALLNNIYYNHAALNVLNIFPSCFYTEVDNREHASIFSPTKYETAKIQINILEFFLTRRAIELNVVILHNVSFVELPNYVGANTLAIFNATGFFNMENQSPNEPIHEYFCNFGVPYAPRANDNFNKVNTINFKLKNKYGYYIAITSKSLAVQINKNERDKSKKFTQCSDRNNTVNPEPLQKYHDRVPIISIGQSLRGKIIFEWEYLGFADCFIYGLLFKRIYDTTAPAAPQSIVDEPPPPPKFAASPVAPVASPVAAQADSASLLPPPPPVSAPPDDVNKANEEPYDKKIDIHRSKLLAARVVAKLQDNVRAKEVEKETARAKKVAEAAAQAKAIADAEAEEELREKAAAKAEEDARLKVLADAAAKQAAEDAARAKQAVEEAARIKQVAAEAARVKQVAAEAARVKLATEAAQVKLATEEAAAAKQAAEEAIRIKLAAEETKKVLQAAEEAAAAKQAAEYAEQATKKAQQARLKRIAEEEEARLQAVKTAQEAAQQAEADALRIKLAYAEQAAKEKETAAQQALADAAAAKLAEQEALKKKNAVWREDLLKNEAISKANRLEASRLEASRLEANRIKNLPQTLPTSIGITIPPATGITNSQKITGDISPDSIVIDMNNENETPTDTLDISLGTDPPTGEDNTLEITIQDAPNKEEEDNAAETQTPQNNNLDIVLGTNAPTGEDNTLEITIEEREGEEEKEDNAVQPPMERLEIVLGTDAPTGEDNTLEISIQEGEGEGEEETQSRNYLQSVAESAGKMMTGISGAASGVASAAGRGIVAAAKGAADTAAKCTTDRAADATRKALDYQVPIKTARELQQEEKVNAQLEELKNQIKDNVADAGELFVDNAKKLANTVASYNPFKGVDTNATKNLLLSQNLNPPVKYLNISINPGIEFNPKMLNKNTSNADVHFNPLIKYSERIINDVPVGQPKAEVYEKFFNNNSFNIMLANTLRGLFGQTPKTIDEATDAGIVDDNIVSTLNTLFATGNVIYINNSPYTIYTYSWNGEWSIDSKMPRNLDYITGTSSSSFIRDQEQIQRYREIQNAAAQKELKQKGIGEKYRMSSILRERLVEDAKQREALQKEQDAKTTAKKVEDDAATKKKTEKQTYRTKRNNELNLRKNPLIIFASDLVPELKKEVMKAALNAIVSHKQFIRATQEERDIEIDPLTISLFYPTDDLLEAMLEKTKLSQDYKKIVDTHKELIKIIEEYDAAEMDMYETKTKMDKMYGKLNFKDNNEQKEEIINELLKGKNLQYDVTKLAAPTFAHVANLFGALSETNPPVTPTAMTGGIRFNTFKGKQVSPEPHTFETIIDSTKVELDASDNLISKKENAVQTEMVKYLGKQIVTTFYNDISELRKMVTRFQQMLENMVQLTTTQYESQRKYYEQYATFLDKLEKASNQTKENDLFLMCIRQDKTSYAQMLKTLIAFDIDKMQIPETIDATNYYKNNSLMGIDSTYFNTFIAQILEKRYSVSNQLWEISFNSALKAHTEFKNETYKINLKKYNELFEVAQQPAADPQFNIMFDNVGSDSPNFWGAALQNRYAEYKQYKKQRDDLQAVQDAPNKSPALISATPLFQTVNPKFKEIYDEYDSKEAMGKRFKTMFIDVALAEIATLRKITFLTQSIHAADIEIYKCMLNEGLFKQHAENCKQTPAVKYVFFNEKCDQSDPVGLLKTNDAAKKLAEAAQKKQDFTGQLTLLSDNQNNMFANLFPIDDNAKLEKLCNQAATDVSTLFDVKTLKTFMSVNEWSNDCEIQEIHAPIAKAFKLAMLNEMFKINFGSNPKKVPQSVYKNTNYWDLFCPTPSRKEDSLNKLLDAVSMLLNAEMHLTSSTIKKSCAYITEGKFDLSVDRIRQLMNDRNENDQLAILYQIFKIKFTIIEINYTSEPLNIKLSIIGCTNKLTARSQSDGENAAYIPEEDVKQIAQEEKFTTFAFIIKCQDKYYIPYNSKIGTLLCSIKHLKSVGLDILLWSNCSSESQGKKKYAPPSWLKMYKTIDAVEQGGGADEQQIASITDDNNNPDKTIEETTKENTNRNAGVPLKSALKKSVKIAADEVSNQDPPAATADTVNYYDKYRVNQTYSRDSKLSYYVAIDLVMVPGTSISLAQKLKLKCQMKSDNIRKSLSDIFGTIYVPTPIFITTSEEYAKSKTEDERNRIIQYQTVTDLVNEKKMNNLKGRDFINAMRETIPRSNRMKNAFTHLRIASGEYNSILKNHDITIEELNSLITDANYQRNFMGGRSKKVTRVGITRLRKTHKQKF